MWAKGKDAALGQAAEETSHVAGKMLRAHTMNGWASRFPNCSEPNPRVAKLSPCGEQASLN